MKNNSVGFFQVGQVLRTPMIKFWASALSYMAFVVMLVAFSESDKVSAGYKLSEHETAGPLYREYMYVTNLTDSPIVQDVLVRYHDVSYGAILICIWLVGRYTIVIYICIICIIRLVQTFLYY